MCYNPPAMALPQWKKKKLERARVWVLANPRSSIAETMRATGVSQATISRIRKELIQAGLVEKFPHTPPPQGSEANPVPSTISTQELMSNAEAEAVIENWIPLEREERRRKLEALVRHGAADHVIRANEAIEKMDARDGSKEDIGPPAPQTLDDGIDQASDIVEALAAWGGEEAVKKAVTRGMERYFEDQKRQQTAADKHQSVVLDGV